MNSATKERINNLIDMNDYLIRLSNDVELFNGILNVRTLEIPSLLLEKEDAIEFTKITYDEIDTGIFEATVDTSPSENCIKVNIRITVATEELTNLAAEGTKKLVKKRFSKLIAKFKRKGMEVMEKERNMVIEVF